MWNVTASISGPKSAVTRVSSLSFKTVFLYDNISDIGIVKMPGSWKWTPLSDSKCYNFSGNIFKRLFLFVCFLMGVF